MMRALFFGWLYGVPFLLVLGLYRRTASPYLATRADVDAFASTTDTLLWASLILVWVLPAAGLALARWRQDERWTSAFTRSFLWSATYLLPPSDQWVVPAAA
ncbi:hypothetical protein ACIA8K_26425 [Catenuloplanes sp. NPDC051500]|uniref:hypothetical protein n=1 Tax=Catenuloplanes sp. NPDC051500 TaxID=3363959 RepID=UPI0037B27C63